jgi:hypothetical protein
MVEIVEDKLSSARKTHLVKEKIRAEAWFGSSNFDSKYTYKLFGI